MVSGALAADAAFAAIAKQRYDSKELSSYERGWKREIGDDLQHSLEIQQRLFNASGRMDTLVRKTKDDPELLRLVIRYSMGASTYEELRNHMMRSTVPTWVWSKVKAAVGISR